MEGQRTKAITAPGGDGVDTSGWILSTYSDTTSAYGSMQGTSMAAPYVSGIAALVFAVDPDLSTAEAVDILCSTAQDLNVGKNLSDDDSFDYQTGYGLVDASAAVAKARGDRTTLHGAEVSLDVATATYSGKAIKPVASVTLSGEVLTPGTDYTVEYSNNTNAGTGKATIKGVGSYTGLVSKTFTISPRKVTPTFSLAASAYMWNGKTKTPGVTVKAKIGTKTYTLKNGTDYSVSYASGRKNVGAYKVTITRKGGNFTFSKKTLTFKINPKAATIVAPMALKKGLTAKWKKQATKMSSSVITGYRVQLATNKTFTKNKKYVTVKGYKNVAKKITGLKAKTTYYVRVQTYKTVGGTPYYSGWSGVKSVKTKA